MGNKIRITTSELSAQAERLRSAAQKAEEIKEKSYQALALVGEAFPLVRKQDYLVISRIKKLISNLEIGAQVAANSAETYNNMDQELRKLMGDSLPDSIVNEPVSNQEVGYTYNNQKYNVLDFEGKILNQLDYGGPFIINGKNYGCTATAWCMGLSMLTGKSYDPTSYEQWRTNSYAQYPGQGISIYNNQKAALIEAYNQLLQGKPTLFYGHHPGTHAVLIVGVSPNADINNLTQGDFLVLDPNGGRVRNLSEVGFSDCLRLITYGDNLP